MSCNPQDQVDVNNLVGLLLDSARALEPKIQDGGHRLKLLSAARGLVAALETPVENLLNLAKGVCSVDSSHDHQFEVGLP